MNAKNIKIDITSDEALVLFEFLNRFKDQSDLNIIDQAEERACGISTAFSKKF